MEQLDHLLVIQGDLCGNKRIVSIIFIVHGVRCNIVLQSTDHGRIIVSEDIQFQEVMVNGVIIKMSCNDPALHIVCRVLDRRELIDVMPVGKYDNTSRMLSCTAPDTRAPFCDTLNLTLSLSLFMILVIILHKAICRLIRKRTDRPCLKCMTLSKQHLCIFMGFRLIITGEIQVDIRLFITLESEESLKGDIESRFYKRFPAHRTVLIRHIEAAASGERSYLIRFKITVMALTAVIMRTQWIYFRDPRHGSHKGGADRSPRSHQISVRIGFPHKLLCNDIHDRIPVGYDRIQFLFQA